MRLQSSVASGEHAVLFWDGQRWSARDLGSKNGTIVDGRRLAHAERLPVEVGTVLSFGDELERWTLEEAGPPVASAREDGTGREAFAEDGLLVLPDAADPRATISRDGHGRWMVELDGAARPAIDHERIDAGGAWTLRVPPLESDSAVPTTASHAQGATLMATTVLRFEVSRDEEFIALSLVNSERTTPLGGRAHHELLVSLARARLRDIEAGVPVAEQGWSYVDELLKMLRLDLHHFNVNVCRARQHLARAGVIDAGALFERRSTTRQIRLATTGIEVLKS